MYIEYYLATDGPAEGNNDPRWARDRVSRYGQDPRFDADGNVWLVDRGIPHRLVKLDPRTGEQKEYLYPDPRNGNHEILIDREGMIWLPEHRGRTGDKEKRLLGFNPKTEQFEHQIPMDPDDVIRNPTKFLQSLAMDSKGNIYIGWIMGGALSKWDRATGEVSVSGSRPHCHSLRRRGRPQRQHLDRALERRQDRQVRYLEQLVDRVYGAHLPRAYATAERGLAEQHLVGHLLGRQAARKTRQAGPGTGKMTEFTIPQQNAEPYDVAADPDDNIWVADVGQRTDGEYGASIWRFDPRSQEFTFYPKPQRHADSPKIQVTRDGAVWYSPRGSREAPAFGVLYPDMDKIDALGAYYRYGPPGYPFEVPAGTSTGGQ